METKTYYRISKLIFGECLVNKLSIKPEDKVNLI